MNLLFFYDFMGFGKGLITIFDSIMTLHPPCTVGPSVFLFSEHIDGDPDPRSAFLIRIQFEKKINYNRR